MKNSGWLHAVQWGLPTNRPYPHLDGRLRRGRSEVFLGCVRGDFQNCKGISKLPKQTSLSLNHRSFFIKKRPCFWQSLCKIRGKPLMYSRIAGFAVGWGRGLTSELAEALKWATHVCAQRLIFSSCLFVRSFGRRRLHFLVAHQYRWSKPNGHLWMRELYIRATRQQTHKAQEGAFHKAIFPKVHMAPALRIAFFGWKRTTSHP